MQFDSIIPNATFYQFDQIIVLVGWPGSFSSFEQMPQFENVDCFQQFVASVTQLERIQAFDSY